MAASNEKNCEDCVFCDVNKLDSDPCHSCNDDDKWEPKKSALRAEVAALQNERDVLKSLLADNLSAWDGEEDSVKEEHAALIEETREAVDGKE
jgi:hypothetical protein